MEFPLELRTRIEQAAASAAPGDLQRAAEAMSEAYRTRTGRGARMVQTEVAVLAYAAARMPATFGAAAQAMAWTRARVRRPGRRGRYSPRCGNMRCGSANRR